MICYLSRIIVASLMCYLRSLCLWCDLLTGWDSQSSCNEIWQKPVVSNRVPAAPQISQTVCKARWWVYITQVIISNLSGQHLNVPWCPICNLLIIYSRSDVFVTYDSFLTGMRAGPQHQENRMVTWGRGETSPPGQADAHSVEDNRPIIGRTAAQCLEHYEICCTYSFDAPCHYFHQWTVSFPPLITNK